MYKSLAKTAILGKTILFVPSCHSTNDISAELIEKGNFQDGQIVITDRQKRGRGQGSSLWVSEPGSNLTFSVILDTRFMPIRNQFLLNMCICNGIAEAITGFLGEGIYIKWPNDIYYSNKKVCGVLTQNTLKGDTLETSVIGIGLNINQEQFPFKNAASLRSVTGKHFDLAMVLEAVCIHIEGHYLDLLQNPQNDNSMLRKRYLDRLLWFNEERSFLDKATGVAFAATIISVDPSGRLVMEKDGRQISYDFKEIEFQFDV